MDNIDGYLAQLRDLPFIKTAKLESPKRFNGQWKADAVIRVETKIGSHRMGAEIKRSRLTRAAAHEISTRIGRKLASSYILLTPYVSAPLANDLAKNKINFVDLAGNYHVGLGSDYLAHVEGRRPGKPNSHSSGLRRSGYRVLFALLVKPELAAAPVRTLAQVAGVSKSGAAEVLKRLRHEKVIGRTTEGRQLLPHPRLLDRWITGYADILRPSLFIGRYRSQETDPIRLEKKIDRALSKEKDWAWGGGAAAFRLTGHYRGEMTLLHMDHPPEDLHVRLKLLPDRDGPVSISKSPGPLAYEGAKPKTVHPLLVYSELIAEGGEREGEAAAEVRTRFLSDIAR